MKIKLLLFIATFSFGQIAFSQTVQLFGTAVGGGNSGAGVLFSINSDGSGFNDNYFMINSFGANPIGGVIEASDHLLYGTNSRGGANDTGVIFSYDPSSGIYKNLYDFKLSTGGHPQDGNLFQASNGKLYGTTLEGGANNFGVIFSFDPTNNSYSDVHDFTGVDGKSPYYGTFLQIGDSDLYGTVSYGGSAGNGVLFKFNPSNNQYTVLQNFGPLNLVRVGDDKIFGITTWGGSNNQGMIFSYSISNNTFADLFNFAGLDGEIPYSGLMLASNGKLYGQTVYGGSNSSGVIFSFDPLSNQYNVLYNFIAHSFPWGPLIQTPDGMLYGNTHSGGIDTLGMVFSFNLSSNQLTDLHDFIGTDGNTPGVGGLTIYSSTLGISPLNKVYFTISPVPSNGIIKIKCPTRMDEIKVTDMLGRIVKDIKPIQTELTIKINEAGAYFISVKSGNEVGTQKLIVFK